MSGLNSWSPVWSAPGGGGVYSAYYGPPSYPAESPGSTAVYFGRSAGIIKAGLTPDPGDLNYWDEGLFAFKPSIDIDGLAANPLSYDVVNQHGTNPVWMTIEIDTGALGDRSDNVTFQMVPAPYGSSAYVTVNAAVGLWQKWNNSWGDTTGNPLVSLSSIADGYPGLPVVRAYLRLGMGNSYGPGPNGTQAWVDKTSIGGVTYDFVIAKERCLKGGWQSFGGLFANQGDCVSFVASQEKNSGKGQ